MLIALLILAVTIALFIWGADSNCSYGHRRLHPVCLYGNYRSEYDFQRLQQYYHCAAGRNDGGGIFLFHSGVTDIIGEKMVKITGKVRGILFWQRLSCPAFSAPYAAISALWWQWRRSLPRCASLPVTGRQRPCWRCCSDPSSEDLSLLVGVGSNASAAGVMQELGYEPFGFFSITPFGIGICIIGTLFFCLCWQ